MKLKDSGIPWMGKFPEHWEVRKIKQVSRVVTGKTPSEESNQDWGRDLMFVTPTDCFVDKKYISSSARRLSQEGRKRFSSIIIPKNSVLVCCIASIGKIALNTEEALTNQQINSVIPNKNQVSADFMFYQLLRAMPFVEKYFCGYSTLPIINKGEFSSLSVVLPPLEEQQAIADFLDRKCNQIEEFITKKEKLISLLEEKKQALISQAVTKGLDQTQKLKNSGIEWLGQIPEHWEVKKLKYVAKIVLGKMLCNERQEGYSYCFYLKSKNLQWMNVEVSQIEKMWFSEYEKSIYRIKKDDLLVSEGGEVGKTCIWNDELEECYIQNSVHKITFNSLNNPRFFLYVFFAYGKLGVFESIVNRVSIAHLVLEKLINIDFAFPPLEEQKTIAEYLDTQIEKIDLAISKIRSQIKLIKEYKTTLISESICGRIVVK